MKSHCDECNIKINHKRQSLFIAGAITSKMNAWQACEAWDCQMSIIRQYITTRILAQSQQEIRMIYEEEILNAQTQAQEQIRDYNQVIHKLKQKAKELKK